MKNKITAANAKEFIGSAQRTYVSNAVKGIDSKARTIRAYASTSAWDRYGERFAPDAFKDGLANFKANPVILFAHDYSQAPIAKAIGYEFDSKGLILTMKFAETDKAKEVFALYEGGFMSAFSVGFRPLELAFEERVKGTGEIGAVFVKAELLENSAVPVPANPEAVVIRGLQGKTLTIPSKALADLLADDFLARAPRQAPEEEPQSAAEGSEPAPAPTEAPAAAQEAAGAAEEPAPQAPPESEKGFAAALTALLEMAKAAKGKKAEDEALRSLLVQTANLCREMLFGAAAERLDGPDQELTEAEAIALVKELEVLGPAVMAKGSADEKAAFSKLSKAVMKALEPISGE